jgi:carotenoid cleavage dioxygenase-like enzyme
MLENVPPSDAVWRKLVDVHLEFPIVHPSRFEFGYKYVYANSFLVHPSQPYKHWDALVKVEMEARKATTSWHQNGCFPGPPLFIPKPQDDFTAFKEDDGLVLSMVYDAIHHVSFILLLDASTFRQVARIPLPEPLAPGYAKLAFVQG